MQNQPGKSVFRYELQFLQAAEIKAQKISFTFSCSSLNRHPFAILAVPCILLLFQLFMLRDGVIYMYINRLINL